MVLMSIPTDHDWEDIMNTPKAPPDHGTETHCAIRLDEQTGKVVRKLIRSDKDEKKIQEFCKVCCEEKDDNKFFPSKKTKFSFDGKTWRCHNHAHRTSMFKFGMKAEAKECMGTCSDKYGQAEYRTGVETDLTTEKCKGAPKECLDLPVNNEAEKREKSACCEVSTAYSEADRKAFIKKNSKAYSGLETWAEKLKFFKGHH